MKWQLLVLIFILLVNITSGVQFSQKTSGTGDISTRANTAGTYEAIQATGGQKHVLYIEDSKDNSRLDSIYRLEVDASDATDKDAANNAIDPKLKRNIYFPTNYYIISSKRPGGIQHSAEIRSKGDISSTNTIQHGLVSASSDFNMSAKNGTIKEDVVTFENSGHGQSMVQTMANGSMGIESHLLDDTKLEATQSEGERLLNSLESVNLKGEVARQESPTIKRSISIGGITVEDVIYESNATKNLMGSISKQKAKVPEFVSDSVNELGITDAEGISKITVSSPADKAAENERGEKLSTKSSDDLPQVADSTCPFNTLAANSSLGSNGGPNKAPNETDANLINDAGDLEGKDQGVNPSDLNATSQPTVTMTDTDTYSADFSFYEQYDKEHVVETEIDTYRLGGPRQRLGIMHVGKKVRNDLPPYFSDSRVNISSSARCLANMTRSNALNNLDVL
jgi:hypothetical protein